MVKAAHIEGKHVSRVDFVEPLEVKLFEIDLLAKRHASLRAMLLPSTSQARARCLAGIARSAVTILLQ